ncbi:MAG TPA: hypothetical protein VE262_07460 [Blastocatellia bacterium]|nr:hypothetical protein [Blastocatellia bacterium]
MHCPRCSTMNNPEQKFCRQCGLPFAALRVALAGDFDDAVDKLKKGENALSAGVLTLCIFIGVAILSAVLGSFDRTPSYAAPFINILLGLIFGLPAIFVGLARIRKSRGLLDNQNATPRLRPEEPLVQLPQAPDTDRTISAPPFLDSVTEHTTLELKPPEKIR